MLRATCTLKENGLEEGTGGGGALTMSIVSAPFTRASLLRDSFVDLSDVFPKGTNDMSLEFSYVLASSREKALLFSY